MAFEDLKAELALLINQMENQPQDPHELYLQIREKLNEMRAFGMPLPEDLVEFEKDLEAQFAATKRAAKKDQDSHIVTPAKAGVQFFTSRFARAGFRLPPE